MQTKYISYYHNSGRSGRNCLSPPVLSGYNGSLDTCFSRGTTQLLSWPGRECYSCPRQFLVVFLLLSVVSTLLFSQTGGILSYRNSSTNWFLNFHQETCAPSSRSLCFLSSTLQRTQPSVKLLSF